MRFEPSAGPTVGVEWELQLLDPVTLDLIDGIKPLMEFFPKAELVKPEYIQSCVELNTRVCDSSAAAAEDMRGTLAKALKRCEELEMGLCGAGTHPFCRRLALITPLPRYKRMAAGAGLLSHTQITFSTHVHVGLGSGDEAMHVMSQLISAVPVFIALSANSPFWRGHDTGHAAYRHRILAAARNYGIPARFDSWRSFEAFLDAATHSGALTSFKDIHWDIRPHPDFGTLELRAMDSASSLESLEALAAFARALVLKLAEADPAETARLLPLDLPHWIESENRYRAAHLGLDADFIVNPDGDRRPLREVAADLVEFCTDTACRHGDAAGLETARGRIEDGADYRRQVDVYEQTNLMRSVVESLRASLVNGIDDA